MDQTLKSNTLALPQTIFFILLLGILLRVIALVWVADYPLLSDAQSYDVIAQQVAQGSQYDPLWPPGLPYYLSMVYRIFGISEFAGRASMIVFYVIMTLALYQLVNDVVSTRMANLAAFIFTIYPNYIYHSVSTLTHLPVAACLMLTVYLTYSIVHQQKRDLPRLLMLGLAMGFMGLTRASSLSVVVFIALYIAYKSRRVLPVVVPMFITGAIIAAYMVNIYRIDNHIILINYANSYNLFVGNNPDTPMYKTWLFGSDVEARTEQFNYANYFIIRTPPYKQDQLYREAAFEHILERPDLFVLRTLNRTRAYFGFDTFAGSRLIEEGIGSTWMGLLVIVIDSLLYLVIMIPAIMFFFSKSDYAMPVTLVAGAALFYALPYFVAFSHATYHFPVTPLFAVLAAGITPAVLKSRGALLAIAIFLIIQIEWGLMMASEFF